MLMIAYVSILIESLSVLAFGMVCPIPVLFDKLYSPQTADILCPRAISRHNIGIVIFLIVIAILTR